MRRELAVLAGTFALSFVVFALGFGDWTFGLGFVLLLLVHELGHIAEGKRQGLDVSLPTFIPFLGAYVQIRNAHLSPWRNALVSLAGPFLGSVGAAVAWAGSTVGDAHTLVELANIGFLLNAANLLPVGFLDGGSVARAIGAAGRPHIRFEDGVPVEALPGDRRRAALIAGLYLLLAGAIVAGMLATRRNGAI